MTKSGPPSETQPDNGDAIPWLDPRAGQRLLQHRDRFADRESGLDTGWNRENRVRVHNCERREPVAAETSHQIARGTAIRVAAGADDAARDLVTEPDGRLAGVVPEPWPDV